MLGRSFPADCILLERYNTDRTQQSRWHFPPVVTNHGWRREINLRSKSAPTPPGRPRVHPWPGFWHTLPLRHGEKDLLPGRVFLKCPRRCPARCAGIPSPRLSLKEKNRRPCVSFPKGPFVLGVLRPAPGSAECTWCSGNGGRKRVRPRPCFPCWFCLYLRIEINF